MPALKLSQNKVAAIPNSDARTDYSDISCPGLILRVGSRTKVYYARVTVSVPGSPRVRKMIKLSDASDIQYKDAVARCRSLIDSSAGSIRVGSSITLSDYLEHHYIRDRPLYCPKGSTASAATVKALRFHLSDAALSKSLHHLSDDDFKYVIANSKGLIDSSLRKIYYAFSAVLNTLVRAGLIKENPLMKRSYPKDSDRDVNAYSFDTMNSVMFYLLETQRDLEAADELDEYKTYSSASRLILALVIDTGCRPREVRLNTAANFTLSKTDSRLIIPASISKTSKQRTVGLNSKALVAALSAHRNRLTTMDMGYMFYNRRNCATYSKSVYKRLWDDLKERHSISGRAYDFRHSFATYVYGKTGDIKLVADLLGDSVQTADKYYVGRRDTSTRDQVRNLFDSDRSSPE